jgi:hypothetical protein
MGRTDPGPAEPLEIASSRMGHLWEVSDREYDALGFPQTTGHDEVFRRIGPVLHADDAVANKVCALSGRALPCDFLDVTRLSPAAGTSLELAAEADRRFDQLLFVDALRALAQARSSTCAIVAA